MKRTGTVLTVLTLLALAAGPALAQPPGGRGGRGGQPGGQPPGGGRGGQFGFGGGASLAMLLGQESVQKDIKLAQDQIAKVKEMGEKLRGGGGGFRDLQGLSREEIAKRMQERAKEQEKMIAEVLKPEQLKRLKQIALQQRGGQALLDPEVASSLKLTDDQKDKLQAITEDNGRAMRELFQNAGGGGDRQEMMKKMEELRRVSSDKMTKILTDEQKTKWKELTGEPFKGEIRFGPPRQIN